MDFIKSTGKTLDEAIANAKKELNATDDNFEYRVVEEGSKGLLGMFGSRPYVIEANIKKRDIAAETKAFVRTLIDHMGLMAEINVKEDDETIRVNLAGPKMGLIIGYRGETLDALQYITNLAINKDRDESYKRIVIDTEGYRTKREDTLKNLADKTAWKVKKYNRTMRLDPMNAYERRIIHSQLQSNPDVRTYSEGEEPFRKVVIELNPQN